MADLSITDGRCQFCHRAGGEVKQLIAGDSAFICSDCIQACVAALKTAGTKKPETPAKTYIYQLLGNHFEPLPPQKLIVTSRTYPLRQQADLQRALDDLFGERRVSNNFVGLYQEHSHQPLSFSKLLNQARNAVEAAPAQYEDVEIGARETVHCLKNGLWLLKDKLEAYAVVLAQNDNFGRRGDLILEIATAPGEAGVALGTRIFDALERRLSEGSCYRGRVLSLEQRYQVAGHVARICVHEFETVARNEVILPEATLRALERNVIEFAGQRDSLRALGLSTQKGLLFHGSPGTGKTHCIRYLAGCLPNHTTLLITAEGAGLLPEYMALARLLQPALVVIEDADLIARERTQRDSACDEVMLNRLLNEMDGLRERADVFFILTTNRPDTLEPALASRPGRIDQAVEFPLPDEALRRRLITLYARSLTLPSPLVEEMARRTDGASPAFIKELVRRIAQHHLAPNVAGDVRRETAEAALHEMLFSGGALNTSLLGGSAEEGHG
jgi:hypothetical protein